MASGAYTPSSRPDARGASVSTANRDSQYWRGRIQLLLPLCLLQDGNADLALVVEKEREGRCYRGNTVLTLEHGLQQ
ncbi:MAG: DUF3825 domain-containing protein, partial [Actinobacteria bacterium]|nr:DUF3825 domain-containing protein [Actinomycetota bacterium]